MGTQRADERAMRAMISVQSDGRVVVAARLRAVGLACGCGGEMERRGAYRTAWVGSLRRTVGRVDGGPRVKWFRAGPSTA